MRIKVVDPDGAKLSNLKMVLHVIHKKKTTFVNVKTNNDGIFLLHDDFRGGKVACAAAKNGAAVWTNVQDGATMTVDTSQMKAQG